jgi:hypothetical protein
MRVTPKPTHKVYVATERGSNVVFFGRDRLKVMLDSWRFYYLDNLRRSRQELADENN